MQGECFHALMCPTCKFRCRAPVHTLRTAIHRSEQCHASCRKAIFSLTVTAPSDRTVLSNMHALRVATSACGKKKTYSFADSPVMSTYLVAVVVGDFDCVSGVHADSGVLTSVYTPVGCAAQGEFALKVGIDALQLLTQLFGVPYFGGRKVDHVAIADFSAGAMENTGCITYREAALLIDPAASSLAMKQRVAQVVAHELSHQWFGNLTTMKWWDNLWLNEGFAKHCEYAVTSVLFPEWDTWSIFTSSIQSSAFSLDSMASTHPIEVAVSSPEQINEIFDTISYQKGASVIRMMFTWLGYEAGWKGLNLYLTRHSLTNTVTDQLWAALAASTRKPVSAVMRKWTACSGYPYLHISRGADGKLKVASKRHIAAWARSPAAWPQVDTDWVSGPSMQAAEEAARRLAGTPKDEADAHTNYNDDWCLPISVVCGGTGGSGLAVKDVGVLALDPQAWADPSMAGQPKDRQQQLDAMASSLTAATTGCTFMKVNAGHGSFYRTLYSPAVLAPLRAACETHADRKGEPALKTTDRLGLVGDVASGVSLGILPAGSLLSFLLAFAQEKDYNVWVAVLDALADVRSAVGSLQDEGQRTAATAALDAYTQQLLCPIVSSVGWEASPGEHANTPLLRAMVLRQAAMAGEQAVVDKCLALFDAYAAGKGSISADLKQLVYNTAVASGGEGRWSAVYTLFKAATSSEEQRRLMTALGRASDSALLSKTLGMLLGDEVRSQDSFILIGAVGSNPGDTGRRLAWNFLKTNWDALHKRLGGGFMLWGHVVGAAIRGFDRRSDADDIEAWFRVHPAGPAERSVKQALEGVRTKAWRAHILATEGKAHPEGFAGAIKALLAQ